MTDWSTCPAVERKPEKVSGAWVFAGTRISLSALYENLASGTTVEEFVEWFPGVGERQLRAVPAHEAKSLGRAVARSYRRSHRQSSLRRWLRRPGRSGRSGARST